MFACMSVCAYLGQMPETTDARTGTQTSPTPAGSLWLANPRTEAPPQSVEAFPAGPMWATAAVLPEPGPLLALVEVLESRIGALGASRSSVWPSARREQQRVPAASFFSPFGSTMRTGAWRAGKTLS